MALTLEAEQRLAGVGLDRFFDQAPLTLEASC